MMISQVGDNTFTSHQCLDASGRSLGQASKACSLQKNLHHVLFLEFLAKSGITQKRKPFEQKPSVCVCVWSFHKLFRHVKLLCCSSGRDHVHLRPAAVAAESVLVVDVGVVDHAIVSEVDASSRGHLRNSRTVSNSETVVKAL